MINQNVQPCLGQRNRLELLMNRYALLMPDILAPFRWSTAAIHCLDEGSQTDTQSARVLGSKPTRNGPASHRNSPSQAYQHSPAKRYESNIPFKHAHACVLQLHQPVHRIFMEQFWCKANRVALRKNLFSIYNRLLRFYSPIIMRAF